MKKYGMTYIIDKTNQRVLLIRKLSPSFLANKLTKGFLEASSEIAGVFNLYFLKTFSHY